MKKYLLFITVLIISANLLFAQPVTFDFEDATDQGATVTQTKGSVLLTVSCSPGEVSIFNAGGSGGTINNILLTASTESATLNFSESVDITSLRAAELFGGTNTWVLTPTGGTNSTVTAIVIGNVGETVILNWNGITSITITLQSGGSVFYILDNIVVSAVLPVELTSFTANKLEDSVVLYWQTATEVNNYGFEILRSAQNDSTWTNIGFVQGHGTSNSPKEYSFIDTDLLAVESVSYRLKQIDNDGAFEYSKTITVDLTNITSVESEDIPIEYSLSQNYPNPFNPSTTIKVALPEAGSYSLNVYNILGQQVASLFSGVLEAGYHNFNFDASKLSTGIYIYTFRGTNVNISKKMSLMK